MSWTSTGLGGAVPGPTQGLIPLYSKASPRNPCGIGRVTALGAIDRRAGMSLAADTPGRPRATHAAIAHPRWRDLSTRGILADGERGRPKRSVFEKRPRPDGTSVTTHVQPPSRLLPLHRPAAARRPCHHRRRATLRCPRRSAEHRAAIPTGQAPDGLRRLAPEGRSNGSERRPLRRGRPHGVGVRQDRQGLLVRRAPAARGRRSWSSPRELRRLIEPGEFVRIGHRVDPRDPPGLHHDAHRSRACRRPRSGPPAHR